MFENLPAKLLTTSAAVVLLTTLAVLAVVSIYLLQAAGPTSAHKRQRVHAMLAATEAQLQLVQLQRFPTVAEGRRRDDIAEQAMRRTSGKTHRPPIRPSAATSGDGTASGELAASRPHAPEGLNPAQRGVDVDTGLAEFVLPTTCVGIVAGGSSSNRCRFREGFRVQSQF